MGFFGFSADSEARNENRDWVICFYVEPIVYCIRIGLVNDADWFLFL